MRSPHPIRNAAIAAGAVAALLAAGAPAARAEGKPAKGFDDRAEFSFVVTSGNSETDTLGFKNNLGYRWERSRLEVKAGGVRANSSRRLAVGTPTDFSVESRPELSAESYFLNGQFDRKITDAFYWTLGAGWERNRFAGIQNRYIVSAGVGNIWVDGERLKFRTGYSLTGTRQEDVSATPGVNDTYLGARLTSSFLKAIGAGTTYANDLTLDENLDDTADYRGDMTNSVSVSVNSRVALKVSLQWLYDHQPASGTLDLFDAPPPDGSKIGTVSTRLKTLDTVFTTSLVINF